MTGLLSALTPLALVFAACQSTTSESKGPDDVVRSRETKSALEFRFSGDDEKLLDEVEYGCFQYFWKEVGKPACLAKDRLKAPVASIAAVGFQLSALPIGVERGWITREQGVERARTVLQALSSRTDNKHQGIYIHFPDMDTAGASKSGFMVEASTVDTALLFAGAMTASAYFGADVAAIADKMIADANWKAFSVAPGGFLSMGWVPTDANNMGGPGKFIEWKWYLASDEERLIYFITAGSPESEFSLPPELYYRLERHVRQNDKMPPFVVSYPGTLFTYFFSHCWIDYRSLGADDPAALGVKAPRVDWFENSRRAVLTHRQRCIELSSRYKTLSAERWGLSACAARDGYIVPEIKPNLSNKDDLFEGTIAPYAAGSSIMFAPREGLAAIRAFRELKGADNKPFVWRDPKEGGYGLADSFNLDQNFAADDYTGIDHGPMLLAIENARTGLIWKWFMKHEVARRAIERLKLR